MKIKLKSLLMKNERRRYCLTPGKLSLSGGRASRTMSFPMQSFLLPVSLVPSPPSKCTSVRRLVGSTGVSRFVLHRVGAAQ